MFFALVALSNRMLLHVQKKSRVVLVISLLSSYQASYQANITRNEILFFLKSCILTEAYYLRFYLIIYNSESFTFSCNDTTNP